MRTAALDIYILGLHPSSSRTMEVSSFIINVHADYARIHCGDSLVNCLLRKKNINKMETCREVLLRDKVQEARSERCKMTCRF